MAYRIGMILDKEFPPDSRVENEAVSLISAGFEVYLFSLSFDGNAGPEKINGINVIRYPVGMLTYKLSALAYTFPFYHWIVRSKIKDFLVRYSIDALHIHDIQVARAVYDVNDLRRLVVLDLHENRPEIMKYYRHVNTLQGRLLIDPQRWKIYQEKYIRESDFLVLVTRSAKMEVVVAEMKREDEIVVVPNTVRKDIFLQYPIISQISEKFSGRFVVLYLGDTGLRRGTDDAIESVNLLKEKIPGILLVLVGENKEDIRLKEMADALDVMDYVAFQGWQDVSLFPSYISMAGVCISPLKRNPHHDTTYANKLFQYMAMGKPLIVSDCPAQAEVVTSTRSGLVFEAGNAVDLAEKIDWMYRHEKERHGYGKNAKLAVFNKWNWEETSKDLVSLYERIAAMRRSDPQL